MGLQLLEREKKLFSDNMSQPDLEPYKYILERQLKPEARKDIIELFEKNGVIPTSMIDISDGLSSELMHICTQSDKGCRIYEDKIPIHPDTEVMAEELNMTGLTGALNGGEDYELLFTVSTSDYEKVQQIPDSTTRKGYER